MGIPMEDILSELQVTDYVIPELHLVEQGQSSAGLQLMTFIPASLQDRVDDIRKVYEIYHKLCDDEFIKRIPDKFKKAWEKMGGLPYYRTQRPMLFRGGVPDVPDFLERHIKTEITFLGEVGVTGGGRQELISALDGAKKWLESVPGIGQHLKRQAIASIPEQGSGRSRRRVIGGWSPRSIIGTDGRPTSMGPHHVGLAVDINHAANPHLKGASATTIDAVLDHLASKGKFSGDQRLSKPFVDYNLIDREPHKAVEHAVGMWIKSMTISEAFKAFLKECLDKKKKKQPLDPDPKRPDVQNLFDRCVKTFGAQKLETFATKGVFDLELALVVALIKGGGMQYGGEFGHSKDQHHFQVRNWNRLFKAPKC